MPYASSPCPPTSPWGRPDHAQQLAPGIWSVSTSSHGGIHLSGERNAAVPPAIRAENCFYEEDCCWSYVAAVHPDAFSTAQLDLAMRTLLDWEPAAYTLLTGRPVKPGESRAFDRDCFYRDNPDAWVVTSAFGDWAAWVEPGMVGVFARQGEPGSKRYFAAERCFLLSAETYDQRVNSPVGYLVDLANDRAIPTPSDPLARRR